MHGDVGLVHGHMGERAVAGDVADGPHPGRDPEVVVHREGPRGLVHAQHAGADAGQVGPPPGRDQQRVPGHLGAVGQVQGERGPVVADRTGCGAGAHLDTVAAEDLREQGARLGFLGRQQAPGPLDHRDPGPEPGKNLGQFRADRPAAEHQERRRDLGGLDGFPVGPVRGAGQALDGRDERLGPRVDDDGTPGPEHIPAHRDLARRGDPAVTAQQGAALAGEPVDRDLVVPVIGGFFPDPLGHRGPVRMYLGVPGQARDPASLGEQVRGADHHLGRDTAPVRALAADQPGLHGGHRQAGRGEPFRGVLAPRAHAQDHDIHLVHGHPASAALTVRGASVRGPRV